MTFKFNHEDDLTIIQFEGDLIGEENGPEIIESVNDSLNNKIIKCAIDISNVRYINSSGIGVLITILTKYRNKGGEVILVNPSEHVKKLLVITKLNAIFIICDDLGKAKEELIKNK
ncbi:MAG: STAS domain-containing protein [Reichenbachiella sp.]